MNTDYDVFTDFIAAVVFGAKNFNSLDFVCMAGLEMTPREFQRRCFFTVGTLGVVILQDILFFNSLDLMLQSMLIASTYCQSIAISIQVLNEFGKIKTPEARMIIGAAVVDDILAIAVLSVVSSIAADGITTPSVPTVKELLPPLRNSLGVISRPAMNKITIAPISPSSCKFASICKSGFPSYMKNHC